MAEPMTVRVEIWPVAADDAGIWLVSGDDAWRAALPVMADSEPHADAELLLSQHDAHNDLTLLHSTSWRVDGPATVLTYVAILSSPGLILDRWSEAKPISLGLAEAVGKPPTHNPVDPPSPRYIDVLMHALRHLRFLLDTDDVNSAALAEQWRRHLAPLEPALAGMYHQDRKAA
jgi:hypothetical protein